MLLRVALLSAVVACTEAFLAPSPRWQAGASVELPVANRAQSVPAAVDNLASARPAQSSTLGLGALLVGALAAGVLSRRSRRTAVTRGVWDRKPAFPNMKVDGDPTRGPAYRLQVNLDRYARKTVGRQRYFKQQQYLRESGITCAKGGYHKQHAIPNFNLYKGPDSHPNNPWFPHMSPGYKQTGKDAVRAWAPAQLGATSAPGSHSSTFTGGSSKRFWRSGRGAGSALVLHAHKKTSASTKNQGHSLLPHFWGLKRQAYQGCAVKAGTRLLKQKGMVWYPGKNVARAKDYSLVALRDGIVQWRGEYRHREITVVPWEYVREKCVWINPNTLGPKEYEPWMGMGNRSKKRHYILKLRKEWLQTEEGQEWQKKKDEKKEKQQEITKKFWAWKKYCKKMKNEAKQTVDAGSGSEAGA